MMANDNSHRVVNACKGTNNEGEWNLLESLLGQAGLLAFLPSRRHYNDAFRLAKGDVAEGHKIESPDGLILGSLTFEDLPKVPKEAMKTFVFWNQTNYELQKGENGEVKKVPVDRNFGKVAIITVDDKAGSFTIENLLPSWERPEALDLALADLDGLVKHYQNVLDDGKIRTCVDKIITSKKGIRCGHSSVFLVKEEDGKWMDEVVLPIFQTKDKGGCLTQGYVEIWAFGVNTQGYKKGAEGANQTLAKNAENLQKDLQAILNKYPSQESLPKKELENLLKEAKGIEALAKEFAPAGVSKPAILTVTKTQIQQALDTANGLIVKPEALKPMPEIKPEAEAAPKKKARTLKIMTPAT